MYLKEDIIIAVDIEGDSAWNIDNFENLNIILYILSFSINYSYNNFKKVS